VTCIARHRLEQKLLTCCRLLLAAPSVPQIEAGVQWALQQKRAGKPVYVRCAHGESAAERMQMHSGCTCYTRTLLDDCSNALITAFGRS
jgi:hypothetical protein